MADLDQTCITTIRTLAMDAVQKANSGHPGAPMGLAPVAYTLWNQFLSYDPAQPYWTNRDRFVLSNGHASMLLYALIHLAGVRDRDEHLNIVDRPSLPLEQLQRFRQLGSHTPGHPESELTSGVETTTGPLGQGVGNAVGMAIAQKWIAAYYSRPGFETLFDHKVYAICGDGCMMEGVASEAASLAGHLRLNNLCLIYDDNGISIDGHTSLAFSEDVAARFEAYGWSVMRIADGNDTAKIAAELQTFQKHADRPTLICVKTHIGYGSPNRQDTKEAHGEALGADEVKLTKKVYGWPEDAQFRVPDGVYDHFNKGIGQRGAAAYAAWQKKFAEYKSKHPDLAAQIETFEKRGLPTGWDKDIPTFPADAKGLATRDSSGQVLNAIAKNVPWVVGGAADLNPSTKTFLKFEGAGVFTAENRKGRNIHFGVREHAMGAIMNGMTLTNLRAYGSGFMIFSDYGRGALRLGAVMQIPVIYVFTHDSIGVGEDGPTHQPIEHLASLRAMPNMRLIRPADANEVAEAYRVAMQTGHHPIVLSLTRQAVPTFDRTKYAWGCNLSKGGYVMASCGQPGTDSKEVPQIILIGTGSEVSLCVEAYEKLTAEGLKARVVSLPSWDLFEAQSQEYRDSVLPPSVKARVCVEMASAFGWERYAGPTGAIIAMRSFGASSPLKDLLKHFGFTLDNVLKAAKEQLGQ
ncbi:MAG TPA: transketolase [Urbifossiella sp.]|nr:transketolase [Urbifossiella sp.]